MSTDFEHLLHVAMPELLGKLRAAHEREIKLLKADRERTSPVTPAFSVADTTGPRSVQAPPSTLPMGLAGDEGVEEIQPQIEKQQASDGLPNELAVVPLDEKRTEEKIAEPPAEDLGHSTVSFKNRVMPTWSHNLSQKFTGGQAEKRKRFEDVLNEFEEQRGRGRRAAHANLTMLERIVTDPRFEIAFSVLIVFNSCVFAVQTQIEGWDSGARRGFTRSTYIHADHAEWRALLDVLSTIGNIMGVIFLVEVVLKILGLGIITFLMSLWNWFDLVIVCGWLLEDMTSVAGLPLDPRALRSFRLMRLLRVMRLLRAIQLFDSLYLLNAAFKGSIGVLVWSMVYLAVVQITLALLLTEGIHHYYLKDDTMSTSQRQEVYDYFGTASRATLTMFEMTLANWPPVCRTMAENVGEWWVAFALLHKLSMGFAFIGIFNGVILQETFKAAAQDSNVMVRDRQRAKDKLAESLRTVFTSASGSGGTLTLEEFIQLCSDPTLKIWLASQGLNTRDAAKVFHLIDNGDGHLTAEELVEGVERFRGVASGIDLHIWMEDIMKNMKHGFQELYRRTAAVEQRLLVDAVEVEKANVLMI